jgi:hypothetical protein
MAGSLERLRQSRKTALPNRGHPQRFEHRDKQAVDAKLDELLQANAQHAIG